MKFNKRAIAATIMAGFLFNACSQDFIEKNISKQTIQLNAPANGLQTNIATQTFWWEQLDGAEKYELQIVKGTFSYVQQFIFDTIVVSNKFNYTLLPGSYQWRVKGVNAGSSTVYSVASFTVDTTTNMSSQIVVLISPSGNFYSSNVSTTFKWDSIAGAKDYRLQIFGQPSNNLITDTAIKVTSYTKSLTDGAYTWQVRAQNNSSNSAYTSRALTIDTTHPNVPILVAPTDSSTTATTHFILTWNRGVERGIAPISDSVFIYSNSALTVLVKDTLTSLTSFSDTLIAGTYYWRVGSINAAGTRSGYSKVFRFTTP